MAFRIPSLADLSTRARQAFRQELPGTDALAWPNTNYVAAKVLAMLLHQAYLRIDALYRQMWAATADEFHLEQRHAYDLGLVRKPAAPATGTLDGTGTPAAVIPAGVRFGVSGRTFLTTAAATVAGDGTVSLSVTAEQAGAGGNLPGGTALSKSDVSQAPALGPTASVASAGLGGGADIETTESLRARVLARKRQPPQGGSYDDYVRFALEVPGVTHAWAAPFTGAPGTVAVWFLFEGRTNGIPTTADETAVATAIAARRLIRAGFEAIAPTAVTVDLTISLSPDTVDLRAAVEAAIRDTLERRRSVGLPGENFVLPKAWLSEAISDTVGEVSHTLTVPSGDLTFTAGQIPVLGTVTWA